MTLLILSTDVPKSFVDLKRLIPQLIPFTLSIALFVLIWFEHFIYFLRYGLKDPLTVVLNTILLTIVLFYVFPLRFLMTLLTDLFWVLATRDQKLADQLFQDVIRPENLPELMIIYGLGVFLIFGVLTLMYGYALSKRDALSLSHIELFDTKTKIGNNLIMAAIPLVSVLFAVLNLFGSNTFTLAGLVSWLYPVIFPIYHTRRGRKRQKLLKNPTNLV